MQRSVLAKLVLGAAVCAVALCVVPSLMASDGLTKIQLMGHAAHKQTTVAAPGNTVVLPAGSVDALAAAIAAAGPGGTVRIEAGMHTESDGVLIDIPVTLSGDPGAVLEVVSDLALGLPIVADAALRVKDTEDVTIQGLDIRPGAGPMGPFGNIAVLVENSPGVSVTGNTIDSYQFGVVLQHADRALVSDNHIAIASVPDAPTHGIIVMNGDKTRITHNHVSGAGFGIWACDKKGQAQHNELTGNVIGLILCNVPPAFSIDGELVGSETPATGWHVTNNSATANGWGILVSDGANNSIVANNAASGNGVYDIEAAGDSLRFGFFTPSSYDNVIAVGHNPGAVVKDCGMGNIVNAVTVDNGNDPCF